MNILASWINPLDEGIREFFKNYIERESFTEENGIKHPTLLFDIV